MPLIEQSSYPGPPWWLWNEHAETIWPSLFRRVKGVHYTPEILELNDGDFLELEWIKQGNPRLVIISHGLEGNAHRHYCTGMARIFSKHEWDVLAWNCRSCGQHVNRLPRLYHHGATDDLDAVIRHGMAAGYAQISLIGFSLGGNLTLKWLGEQGKEVPLNVKCAVASSVPCDLQGCAGLLDRQRVAFYRKRFLSKLRKKILIKAKQFPDIYKPYDAKQIKTFEDFDNGYTAPIHGFANAQDYYKKSASGQYLHGITIPTLLVNALNDPFLSPDCYPTAIAKDHPVLTLEMPKKGGHVGFTLSGESENWMERRALAFVNQHVEQIVVSKN